MVADLIEFNCENLRLSAGFEIITNVCNTSADMKRIRCLEMKKDHLLTVFKCYSIESINSALYACMLHDTSKSTP